MNGRERMKRVSIFLLVLCVTAGIFGIFSAAAAEDQTMIYVYINDSVLTIKPSGNSSSEAFIELLKAGDLTIEMQDYGNFEKVGPIGTTLPRNDEQITTKPGDVILYMGTQITIYYAVNSWNFTRLGQVQGMTDEEIRAVLGGKEGISARFSLNAPTVKTAGEFDLTAGTVLLNSGYEMPVIGLGTWSLSDEQAENSVYHALKSGMRLIDTARYYRCETGVGRGIRRAIDEGIVTREEVFVTSKIMPGDYDRAAQGIRDSLTDLGLDYLDLMLIHQPGRNDAAVYQAMEDAVREGKIRSIGISNYYTPEAVEEVLSYAGIMPAVIQNENHLFYQNDELRDYVKQYGIVLESWYPFGGRGHTAEHLGNETIADIASAHGKTPAQVILRWQIQDGYIAIPGSSDPAHIAENFDIFDFHLSEDELNRIRVLDQNRRYENW